MLHCQKIMQLFEMFNFEDWVANMKSAYNTLCHLTHQAQKRQGPFQGAWFSEEME